MAWIRPYVTSKGERRYSVVWRDAAGRQRERVAGPLRKDALTLKRDIERRLALGHLYEEEAPLLGVYLDEWLERYAAHGAAERTVKSATSLLRAFDSLRDVPVDELAAARVEDAVTRLVKRAPTRGLGALVHLRHALRDAQVRGVRVDPAIFLLKAPRLPEARRRFLSWAEVEALAEAMPDDSLNRAVRFAALTGLRRGEQGALTRLDVNPAERFVVVRRGKTRGSRRRVELGATAARIAAEQLLSGALWPQIADRAFDRVWDTAKTTAGVECRWHDLRHTYAALMAATGAHPKVLADQMGHSSIRVTMDVYGHLFPGATSGAADALDALVSEPAADEATS